MEGARARLSSRPSGKKSSGTTRSNKGTCGGARYLASLQDERDGGGRRWFTNPCEVEAPDEMRQGNEPTARRWKLLLLQKDLRSSVRGAPIHGVGFLRERCMRETLRG